MPEPDRKKILIVDDDPVNVRVLEMTLKDEYEIFSAFGGKEALSLTREKQPQLILLDVMMPEVSGFDVCKALKEDQNTREIPVIFVTALDKSVDEMKGLSLGAIDYIFKPINPILVRLRVKNQLELLEQRDLLSLKNQELEAALQRLKVLEGIIPICMYCKKIRDEQEAWQKIENYISQHSNALFSHGICPECAQGIRKDKGFKEKSDKGQE